jgi:hypothetical protein
MEEAIEIETCDRFTFVIRNVLRHRPFVPKTISSKTRIIENYLRSSQLLEVKSSHLLNINWKKLMVVITITFHEQSSIV